MRPRSLLIMVVLVVGVLGAGVGAAPQQDPPPAVPQAICDLPGQVFCASDSDCVGFNAFCDVPAMTCVCPSADLGPNSDGMVAGDGGTVTNPDLATGSGGQTGGAMTGSAPRVGGGMDGPVRTGCSFVPGSAR